MWNFKESNHWIFNLMLVQRIIKSNKLDLILNKNSWKSRNILLNIKYILQIVRIYSINNKINN